MKIKWMGWASWLIKTSNKVIYIDPFKGDVEEKADIDLDKHFVNPREVELKLTYHLKGIKKTGNTILNITSSRYDEPIWTKDFAKCMVHHFNSRMSRKKRNGLHWRQKPRTQAANHGCTKKSRIQGFHKYNAGASRHQF